MEWLDVNAVALITRVFLVMLFPFSALDKIFDWQGALKQARSSFLPGAPVLLVLGMLMETIAPACIILAWHDRLAAFMLAGYSIVTALLYHNFWHYPDFWKQGESIARNHFWDFLKNFGLAGGLLLVTFSGSLVSIAYVISHPLSSTSAYTVAAVTHQSPAANR